METKSNKTIVLECYKNIIGQLDISMIDTYVDDQYIQHSPTVKDGKEGLLEMVNFLRTLPQPAERKSPIVRAIADGDFVVVHLDLVFMGKRFAVIDLFRLQNGKLIEHWDGGQEIETDENSFTNGTVVIDVNISTENNKALIDDFYKTVFTDGNIKLACSYLKMDYVEHTTGIKSIAAFLTEKSHNFKATAHRIIGEGDFVMVQSELSNKDSSFVMYDIFRLENNKIGEHWSVMQQVPAVITHANGMI